MRDVAPNPTTKYHWSTVPSRIGESHPSLSSVTTMNPPQQQQLQSYQRETINTASPVKRNDGNGATIRDSRRRPLAPIPLPPWRRSTGISTSIMVVLLGICTAITGVILVRFAVIDTAITPTIQIIPVETTVYHTTGDKNPPQQQQQHRHRDRMIRQQLSYLQEHMEGTIYFPPCPDAPRTSDEALYDVVATGWIKQRPAVWNMTAHRDANSTRHCHSIGIVIVQVHNEHDVQVAVPVLAHLYHTYEFPFRIRSGGHHKAGYSSLSDVRNSHSGEGAVLSLSFLNQLRIVPTTLLQETNNINTKNGTIAMPHLPYTSIVIGPAVKVQDVLQQVTSPYRYGGVIGFCNQVAEGGFVLGGGFGVQSRMYGLGIDSVLSFRMVLFNGTVVTTTHDHNSDLHWALLGAGSGSYGVITEMEYKIHPVSDLLQILQLKFHNISTLAHFLYQIGNVESTLPDNVVLMYDAMNAVSLWWTGSSDADVQNGNVTLQNLVESIVKSDSATYPFDSIQQSFSWTESFGRTNFSQPTDGNIEYYDWGAATWAAACWTGFLLPENNTIEVWNDIMYHLDIGLQDSQPYLEPDIELWGGDIGRRTSNATAFPYRSAIYNVGVLLVIPLHVSNGTEIFERESKKINEWWYKIDQYLTGSYVNYPMVSLLNHTDPHHYAKVYWGDNLPRLVKVKQQYDPDNVFRFPMSVPNIL